MNVIVLLDSDHVLRNILTVILSRIGYQVYSAGDGQEGMQIITKTCPDLIIVEEALPDTSGLELCRLLRKKRVQAELILMTTMKAGKPSDSILTQNKISDCLIKPFDNNTFITRIIKCLPPDKKSNPPEINESTEFEIVNTVEDMKYCENIKKLLRRIVLLGNCWEKFKNNNNTQNLLTQMIEFSDFTEFGIIAKEHTELYKITSGLGIILQKLSKESPEFKEESFKETDHIMTQLKDMSLSIVTHKGNATHYFENLKILSNIDSSTTIFITAPTSRETKELKSFLENKGYSIKTFSNLYDLMVFTTYDPPAVIILDYSLIKGNSHAVSFLNQITKPDLLAIPLLFISDDGDYKTRLKAIQASGQGFFMKPLIYEHIDQQICQLVHNYFEEPFRILYIENNGEISQSIMFFLNSSGIEVEKASDTASSLEIIPLFNPDCILVGNNPSPTKSRDFIRVMSQFNRFKKLPVIFMTESKTKVVLPLSSPTPYAFLSQETSPAILTSTISIFAGKYRKHLESMRFEKITGLLNHKTFKKHLDIEINRAMREEKQIVLAFLEIEHRMTIIETVGISVYEKILRDFSSRLNNIIRKVDIAGFIGKNRFAVLFTRADKERAHIAVKKIQAILTDFTIPGYKSETPLTLVCGMAEYPDFDNRTMLMFSAENALLRASEKGQGAIICSLSQSKTKNI